MLTSEFLKDSSAARGTQDYTFGQGRGTEDRFKLRLVHPDFRTVHVLYPL